MKKSQFLEHWKGLEPNQAVAPAPVPYRHEGSTFDQDAIRITGRPEFIDAVLSRLKDLLDEENDETRLQVTYQEAKDKETGETLGSYAAYIQVHERGGEAQILNKKVSLIKQRRLSEAAAAQFQ